jgi:hypothetical protein
MRFAAATAVELTSWNRFGQLCDLFTQRVFFECFRPSNTADRRSVAGFAAIRQLQIDGDADFGEAFNPAFAIQVGELAHGSTRTAASNAVVWPCSARLMRTFLGRSHVEFSVANTICARNTVSDHSIHGFGMSITT